MAKRGWTVKARSGLYALLIVAALILPAGVTAQSTGQGNWWDVPPEPENPSPYYNSILYSEIPPKLREIEVNSNRVRVEVIGQSAGGRNLFLATVSAPEAMGRLGQYQAISQTMLKDPDKAQEMIEKFGDFKVPFFVNASIHGTEYPGVDAAMQIIETLAYDDSEEVQAILDNVILLVNVVQNPDGRVMGSGSNANGFNLNRDFIPQTQPEVQATVRVITEWNPMVLLDLHGFSIGRMLIEPCTPPHNPNYEYDLYVKWALGEAEAMEAELYAQEGWPATIPYRDRALGWDDWAPNYTPMYAMFHGAYGHTLETLARDEDGVRADYLAIWGALKFVAANRQEMVHDQIEIFRRGYLDMPQQPIPPELLPDPDQYPEIMLQEFPAAYVIPPGPPFQLSPHQPAKMVNFLLFNDVQVEQASQAFNLDGVDYPAGSYVVWLDQPKRGLANTVLGDGLNLSDIPGLAFYSPPAVWSYPREWGVYMAVMDEPMEIQTHPVNKADPPLGSVEGGKAGAYAYFPTSIRAIQAANDLLGRGVELLRMPTPFADRGRDFDAGAFILPASAPGAKSIATELANGYGLDVSALSGVPEGAVALRVQKIAVNMDSTGRWQLQRFGFDYDAISAGDLNNGLDLSQYDMFINTGIRPTSLNATGQAALVAFFGGDGDYIGIGTTGASLAQSYELLDFGYTSFSGNTTVHLGYDPADPVAAGFGEQGAAFVNPPMFYTDLAEEVAVAAWYRDTSDFVIAGYWPGWQTSGAQGQPIVIHNASGVQDTMLFGMDPIFRAHPEDSFRMVANAIYSGLE